MTDQGVAASPSQPPPAETCEDQPDDPIDLELATQETVNQPAATVSPGAKRLPSVTLRLDRSLIKDKKEKYSMPEIKVRANNIDVNISR